MVHTSNRKRKPPSVVNTPITPSNTKEKNSKTKSKQQSVLSQLRTLRELLHGSHYSESDLSTCLRQCGYNVETAAEQLVTGQFVPNDSRLNSVSPLLKRKKREVEKESIVVDVEPIVMMDECYYTSSQVTQESNSVGTERTSHKKQAILPPPISIPKKKSQKIFLLCQRWTIGFCTSRLGSIHYDEVVTLSTSIAPLKKGANIVRFKGMDVEGTLDSNLSSMIAPLIRVELVRIVARGLMDDPTLRIGQEVPLSMYVYILEPVAFFELFPHGDGCKAAFKLLQWGQYGDALPAFDSPTVPDSTKEDDVLDKSSSAESETLDTHEEEVEAPSWAGDAYANASNELPEESDPTAMTQKGITLKSYQRQALHWMLHRESNANDPHNTQFREQLELLAELSASHRSTSGTHDPSASDRNTDGVQCSVGPVLVSDDIASRSKSFDGILNPPVHPLWQRRFLWDQRGMKHDEDRPPHTVNSFYVNELLNTASIIAPNPPNQFVGSMLCASMGSGKTVMLIALISKEKHQRHGVASIHNTTLVVAPLSLLAQWEEEINTKSALSCVTYYGDQARRLSTAQISNVDVLGSIFLIFFKVLLGFIFLIFEFLFLTLVWLG